MNKDDFHIPFVKSLVIVAIVTVFAMVSSHYLVNYYCSHYHYQYSSSQYATPVSSERGK